MLKQTPNDRTPLLLKLGFGFMVLLVTYVFAIGITKPLQNADRLDTALNGLNINQVSRTGDPQDGPAAAAVSDDDRVDPMEQVDEDVTQGALRVEQDGELVECPLKHTDVQADISGFIARVNVTQTFTNPTDEPIEAVYVFPLPHKAAVDQMTMVIGERRIVGQIKRRDDARQIYEQALASGQTASLLEQERPNIFTQSVGNIEPGQDVQIEISYVDTLEYDMGIYEFHFPMVVGPRYMPSGGADLPDDVGRINASPILQPEQRSGHDVTVNVELNAGVPVHEIETPSHETFVGKADDRRATVSLSPTDTIPNKDFVMRYKVVGEKPEMAVLAHTRPESHDARRLGDGYFLLMIQPGEESAEALAQMPPREIIFLVDVSGSMRGEKTEQVKECMRNMLGVCRDEDRFQIVKFASQAEKLFDAPVAVNEATIAEAMKYNESSSGSGGTEMLRGIQMAIDEPITDDRLRIVVLLSDGFIGNEAQIIEHVGQNCGDQIRFWAIGVDASPNMFLIDGVARQGGGMGKRLAPNEPAEPITTEIMSRIQRAQLAKVNIEFGDFDVCETYPAQIPELWAGRPIMVYGRYRNGGDGKLTVNGSVEGEPVSWSMAVSLSEEEPSHDVIAKNWARQKIEELMQQSFYAGSPAVEEEVTAISLNYGLMSQYTSFVAVDSETMPSTERRLPRRMRVPIPLPEFNQWEGYFGDLGEFDDDGATIELARVNALFSVDQSGLDGLRQQTRESVLAELNTRTRGGVASYEMAYRMQQQGFGQGQSFGLANGVIGGGGGGGFGGGGFGGGGGYGGRAFSYNSSGVVTAYGRASRQTAFGAVPSRRVRGRYESRGLSLPSSPSNGPAIVTSGRELADSSDAQEAEHLASENWIATLMQVGNALSPQANELLGVEAEQVDASLAEIVASARAAIEEGDFETAKRLNSQVYYVASLIYPPTEQSYQLLTESAELAADIESRNLDAIKEALPSLTNQLDLVLRDVSLAEALTLIGEETGIECVCSSEAIRDAKALLGGWEPRIDFLDLRNVVAADAVQWLGQEFGLTLLRSEDGIELATLTGIEGRSVWVYDLNAFVLPLASEIDNPDQVDPIELLTKSAEEFRAKLLEHAGVNDDCRTTWYSSAALVVDANSEDHAKIASILDGLRHEDTEWDGERGQWKESLRERIDSHMERVARNQAIVRHQESEWLMTGSALDLLTAASGGELDVEALTYIQVSWETLKDSDSLDDGDEFIYHLVNWMVHQSLQMLSESEATAAHDELMALEADLSAELEDSETAIVERLAESPTDRDTYYAVLFAALRHGRTSNFTSNVLELLEQPRGTESELADIATVASALLQVESEVQSEDLAELLNRKPDNVFGALLLAMACHELSGQAWTEYRVKSPSFAAQLTPEGQLAVIANRLPQGLLSVE